MKKNYKDLLLWQMAIDLTPKIYSLIRKLPKEETFALGMQLRRAVISVPSNIAEGQHESIGRSSYNISVLPREALRKYIHN